MLDQSQLKIWEKSRRIGASWCEAAASVLAAIDPTNPRNTVYVSYNREMTEGFIRDCETWAKAFNAELRSQQIETIIEEDDILGYRMRFATGREIKALSSKPKNIRGKQARVVVDEAAFCDELPKLIAAAIALLMWGGSLIILSTHNGIENFYNELLEEIKAGGQPDWSLHRTNIHDALNDGLYQRICLMRDIQWSPEAQDEWLASLLRKYGSDAEEELLCIPFQGRAGKVFNSEAIAIADEIPAGGTCVRFWDLAATERDQKGPEPCYTAGVKMKIVNGVIYILDLIAVQESAGAIDELMRNTAIADGKNCLIRWELEGGSAGKRDAAAIGRNLQGFDAAPVRPQGDKVKRSKPLASQVNLGNCRFARNPAWNKNLRKWMFSFPDGKVKDPIDAANGAYAVLTALEHYQGPPPSSTFTVW